MEDRITIHYIYICLFSALLTLFLSILGFHSILQSQAREHLTQITQLISQACQSDPNNDVSSFASEEFSIALMSDSGELFYTSDPLSLPASELRALTENAGAAIGGTEIATFRSAAGGKRLLCAAAQLPDGTLLCVFTPAPRLLSMLSGHYGYLILMLLLLAVLSFGLSWLLTRRLIKPIKLLSRQITRMDFDPQKITIYPELIPLIQEITERRNEREAMRQEFTANVSHELKTPLTTISGYSEMIASGIVRPEDIQRFAAKIHAESERMQSLVADIIELNALDSKAALEHPEPVQMLPLAQDCVEQLSPHFLEKGLSVYITGEGFSVQGDARQLWELIYNLLDNARRYNVPGGSIHISIRDRVLSVKDTGIGIPAEHQGRVFERFYRVDKSHSRATGGTGLGLSIVKHVAELHNAKIELESTEQVGTEIRIIFPS